ncbi:hypothetical protein OBRU01_15546 [Operophtera brumata]|uniref:Uncharacterized protein n=1 Tax=Operophtera brumata TaxID=104452 RepID=A0A0L7L492_OPEBR|nr:hypothetical protein OBRU01_15546 [Operophtera brumata]
MLTWPSEFNKLPAVFHLDPFEDCVEESNPVYCSTEFVPVSETPNTLLDTIREYSEHTATHFNYSLLRYGVCLNFCKQYKHNTTTDLKHTLEACLNQKFLDKYGLNTSLQYFRCNEVQKKIEFIPSDIIMLVVLIAILLLNLVGSCCDYYKNMGVQLFLNGPILVQKFFIMSGFLLVYNLLLQSEKHRVDWTMLPRGILLRLIRYLAADMQLYCLGLVVFLACKNPTSRKVVLSLLLFIGLVLPPLHTYFQDLNGILLVSPDSDLDTRLLID